MRELFVGIDTSNYTTSLALVDNVGELVANIKLPLPVRAGELGLRQSAALFEHTKNLPEAFERARVALTDSRVLAVGVSARPRNKEGSYMPCFLAGVSAASAFAAATNAPLYRFSHQCGHIRAAIYGSGAIGLEDGFSALHISGGTTEMLIAKRDEFAFACDITGGTLDLCAGQAVDRTGVMLGFPFPCGVHIEKSALEYTDKIKLPRLSVKETYFNLSGLENMVKKEFEKSKDTAKCSRLCLEFIAANLRAAILSQIEKYGERPVICSGGVMSNSIIKERLADIPNIYFAPPALSADNAVGVALLTFDKFYGKD